MRWSHSPVAPVPTPPSASTERPEAMDVEEDQALPASSEVPVEMDEEREVREGRRSEEEEETERSWNR